MTQLKDLLIIFLFSSILFGTLLGSYPLDCPDSARYAEIPREMLVTGDYLTPHLNGLKYFEKPPLFYWIQTIGLKIFGINEFGAGFMNILIGVVCCLVTYLGTRKIFDRRSALLASFILATSMLFFILNHVITLDMALTLFLTAGLFTFISGTEAPINSTARKGYFLGTFAFMAFAVMTKGLAGVFIPALIFFFYLLVTKDWQNLKGNYYIFPGLIVFLIIVLPWHILVQMQNPEFSRFYFIEQHFLRYLTNYAERSQPWWFFPAVLLGGFYPWTTFLFQAVAHNFLPAWKARLQNKKQIFLFIWPIIIYAFYSFSKSKLITYLLPLLPPLAALTGKYFSDFWQIKHQKHLSCGFYLLTLLNLLLGSAMFLLPHFYHNGHLYPFSGINTYHIGIAAISTGIITALIYFRFGSSKGLIVLILTTSLFLITLKPAITIANRQSIRPLAMLLKTKLHPEDEVVTFRAYYQDLPFYLQRTVTVSSYEGELKLGIMHTKDAKNWMISGQTFINRWIGGKKMFMITGQENYEALRRLKLPMYLLGGYLDKVLVTNKL